MAKIFSQLVNAQAENKASDYSAGTIGRFWINTASSLLKFDDGSAVRTIYHTGNTVAVANGGTNITSYTTGDVLYATGATTLSKLAIGTSGTFLKSNGSAILWDTAGTTLATTSKTGNYTATTADNVILCDDTSGSLTITLYAAASNAGRQLMIKKTNSSSNTVTIDGNASETIDGATTQVLRELNESILIVCDGSNWRILDRYNSNISARYSTNAGQSISTATDTVIDFEDKTFDSHTAVTTGAAWKFTAPIDGVYSISAVVTLASSGAWSATEGAILRVFKNGADGTHGNLDAFYSTGSTTVVYLSGSTLIKLVAGDYIHLNINQNSGSSIALLNDGNYNHVSIQRIGN